MTPNSTGQAKSDRAGTSRASAGGLDARAAIAVEAWSDRELVAEIRNTPDLSGPPLVSLPVTHDLEDLLEETFVNLMLSGVGAEHDILTGLKARFEFRFSTEPLVQSLDVCLEFELGGELREFRRTFKHGRWNRTLQHELLKLDTDVVGEDQTLYQMLIALPARNRVRLEPPPLQPPPIVVGELSDIGVRELSDGQLDPDRPVLVNRRLSQDSIAACLSSGSVETGRAVVGAHLLLREPLPRTNTRVVTVLTMCLDDPRHEGQINEWKISPEALADAARIADARGLRESVLTVMHTHGWANECGNCNENPNCPLAECTTVSLKDYHVLETLFPSKATLMPIAGRKLGAGGRRPVLEIHAWQGGRVAPLRWQQYLD